ncbi:MAG: SDR family oxidoreductase [Bryobacteraceae bacterium]|nr:SDR family oxidoreductase [Bryobacteraceae bacterium]
MPVLDLFRLDGKLALVTGCRRGIGRAMALALAEAGADIIGVSRHMQCDSGNQLAHAVASLGRQFRPYACDLGDRTALYHFVDRLFIDYEAIDILVNNAGTILRRPAADHPDDYWDEVLETNLTAPFVLAREVGKRMVARGRGKIIFTASLLSFQGGITVPGYAASKGGVAQLAKALSNEWAGCGVQVNAIAPGYIATDNTMPLREDPDRARSIVSRIPAGRWGVPEDLAGATVFLASEASDYVNGTVLTVDGGWLGR